MMSQIRLWCLPFGLAALAGTLALPLTARAGETEKPSRPSRGIAILPPTECPDTDHPHQWKCLYTPYYSPLTPIPCRWRPVVYIPYYCGYCADVRVRPKHGAPYGVPAIPVSPDDPVYQDPGLAGYGGYAGAPQDEQRLLHLGGNGPYSPINPAVTDLIDAIHNSRGPGGACPP